MALIRNGNYYSNPAFCQKSEFYNQQVHSNGNRQPPVGANTSKKDIENDESCYEEQDFYEEMVLDNKGIIQEKKILVVSQTQNNEGKMYIQSQQSPKKYDVQYYKDERTIKKHRYEYIPMKEQVSPTKSQLEESNVPRYAVIDVEDEPSVSNRYALVPVEDLKHQKCVLQRTPSQLKTKVNSHRYEYIDEDIDNPEESISCGPRTRPKNIVEKHSRYEHIVNDHPPDYNRALSPSNLTPTQRLYELLSTPKKNTPNHQYTPKMMSPNHQYTPKMMSPISPRIIYQSTPKTPQRVTNTQHLMTPNKSLSKPRSMNGPKAQQKLNYAIGVNQQLPPNKRHTAIVAPICSSPVQSIYSDTVYSSSKTESWMNMSVAKAPLQATLAVAALMMFLCGALSSGLCFYMISILGSVYYLEFGVAAGFACLTLGILGFRTRHCYWLPNRNYISGYIVLSVFSLLTCAALLVLLFMQPRPGTPLADMTSGAVSGISVLSLCLAVTGVASSYCCQYPPPDNRVQHCAQGFVV